MQCKNFVEFQFCKRIPDKLLCLIVRGEQHCVSVCIQLVAHDVSKFLKVLPLTGFGKGYSVFVAFVAELSALLPLFSNGAPKPCFPARGEDRQEHGQEQQGRIQDGSRRSEEGG